VVEDFNLIKEDETSVEEHQGKFLAVYEDTRAPG